MNNNNNKNNANRGIRPAIFTILLVIVLIGVIGLTLYIFIPSESEPSPQYPHKKIIIDTDSGADDVSAIILAAASRSMDILGVTTVEGNVGLEQSTKNALMALEMAGYDAPVYQGADKTFSGRKIKAYSVYGKDGMGDADLVHPNGTAQQEDAVSFMLKTIAANPGEVEIVAIGPATNIADAIRRDPETMKKVKRIWSMGTTGLGPGNASPVAEFNVYHDAEAYRMMLESDVPTTVIGLDMCGGEDMWTNNQFDSLSGTNAVGQFISTSFRKLRDFDRANGSAEAAMNCDATAMMCVLDPDFADKTIAVHGSCITTPGETYGQVIFYRKGFTYDVAENNFDYNVTLVTEVEGSKFFEKYRAVIASLK